MNPHLNIQPAVREEAAEIVTLVNEAYWSQQKQYLEEGPQALRTTIDEVGALIQNRSSNKTLFVLKLENKIKGAILFQKIKEKTAMFGMFAVHSSCKGMGLGDRLIAKAEECAKIVGCTKIKIEVMGPAVRLMHYYQAHGYQPVKKIPWEKISPAVLKSDYKVHNFYQKMVKTLVYATIGWLLWRCIECLYASMIHALSNPTFV